ncbi:MAG: DUF389 domain-containing protein [Bacteroidaceae bacterium]|nr:DUF389 domain-containing protein [Bacteroidaceae bacterium]
MNIWQMFKDWLGGILSLGEDMAPEKDTIAVIEAGVDFRGAKLWILILAVFVASLGLNTNSAAVIIGAMLISPLMGPIIGMGLGIGINDFMLFKRAAKNYLVATLFSVATATLYFLLTPLDEVQSELLARTSPTIYDVGIALCGGLAGIVALSSRSQRTGNVIPGVAIATALMPPLCTVGFGLGTGNWLFAAGALYLYLINTIFISLATFIGVTLVMRFPKKVFVDKAREKRVKHIISFISVITIIPSIFITFQMVQETVFRDRCQDFYRDVLQKNEAKIISQEFDYGKRTIRVVMLGEEVDSMQIAGMSARLPQFGLEGVHLDIVQGAKGVDMESLRGIISTEKNKTLATQKQLAENEQKLRALRDSIDHYMQTVEFSRTLLPELTSLFPQVGSVSTGRGVYTYWADSVMLDSAVYVVNVSLRSKMSSADEQRMENWLRTRLSRKDIKVVMVHERP